MPLPSSTERYWNYICVGNVLSALQLWLYTWWRDSASGGITMWLCVNILAMCVWYVCSTVPVEPKYHHAVQTLHQVNGFVFLGWFAFYMLAEAAARGHTDVGLFTLFRTPLLTSSADSDSETEEKVEVNCD